MNYLTVNQMSGMSRILNQFHAEGSTILQRGFNVDIAESAEEYQIDADLPGFSAENVNIRVEDNLLVIEAKKPEKSKQRQEENRSWYVRERKDENLKRSFILPEDARKEGIRAEMENGMLSIILEKDPEEKPFSITIQDK